LAALEPDRLIPYSMFAGTSVLGCARIFLAFAGLALARYSLACPTSVTGKSSLAPDNIVGRGGMMDSVFIPESLVFPGFSVFAVPCSDL
jgi:hypothetical protein